MAPRNPQDTPEPNLAETVQEISERASLLVREEIELAKAEVTEKVTKLVKGAVVGLAAGVFVLFGLFFLLNGFAWLAYYLLPVGDLEFHWGFFFVAGVLFVLGGIAGFLAAKFVKAGSSPAPTMAIEEAERIKETVQEARQG